jgi:hypothetical protein
MNTNLLYNSLEIILVNSTKSSSPSSISSSSRRPSGPFQIKLRNPPVGRRPINGTSTSNNPSITVSSSINDQLYTPEQPPPIPPRSSLLNTTNKRVEGQFVRPGETPIKAKRTIIRSRNVKRREPITTTATVTSKNNRSDSADALSVPSSEHRYRNSNRRPKVQIEQETNSD